MSRHPQRVVAVPVHPHAERLDPAQGQPGVERAGHRAGRVLQERQPLAEVGVGDHDRPADDVGVTAQVLGGGVDHDVGAERQRLLQVRRGEACCPRPAGRPRRGRSRPARRCRRWTAAGWSASRPRPGRGRAASRERGPDGGQVGHRHRARRPGPSPGRPCRTAGTCRRRRRAGSARGRRGGTRCGPGSRRPPCPRRRPATGRPPSSAARHSSSASPGGVGRPGVLVAAAQAADPVLLERGHLVDRRDHRAGDRVRLLPGVDGEGLEAVRASRSPCWLCLHAVRSLGPAAAGQHCGDAVPQADQCSDGRVAATG